MLLTENIFLSFLTCFQLSFKFKFICEIYVGNIKILYILTFVKELFLLIRSVFFFRNGCNVFLQINHYKRFNIIILNTQILLEKCVCIIWEKTNEKYVRTIALLVLSGYYMLQWALCIKIQNIRSDQREQQRHNLQKGGVRQWTNDKKQEDWTVKIYRQRCVEVTE